MFCGKISNLELFFDLCLCTAAYTFKTAKNSFLNKYAVLYMHLNANQKVHNSQMG